MSPEPAVYVTRQIPEIGIERLEQECDVTVWKKKLPPSKEQLMEILAGGEFDGILCLLSEGVDGELMDASGNLTAISTFSVGYDHIDIEAASDRDIPVGHTPGVLTETTADYTWALVMTCARRTIEGHEYVLDGKWETWGPTLLTGPDVHGSTLGIIGLGNIGAAVAKRTAGFDMTVLYSDVKQNKEREQELEQAGVDITYVPQDELLQRSDFVSIHVPLFDATHHLIGEQEFRTMKDDAILINTSRGPIVDTDALNTALEKDWIARAGVDVIDPEPLPVDHQLIRYIPEKFVVTPHIASASIQTRNRMAEMAAENLLAGLDGKEMPNSAVADAGVK